MISHQLRVLLTIRSPSTFQSLPLDILMMLTWRLVNPIRVKPPHKGFYIWNVNQICKMVMVGCSGSFVEGC